MGPIQKLFEDYLKSKPYTGRGLLNMPSDQGLSPYGLRHSGDGAKGLGFFGLLPHAGGGYSTELSSEADGVGEFPLLVPTLSRSEIQGVLNSDAQPPDETYQKALSWAQMRKSRGLSPFAQPNELRMPLPK